MVKYRGSRKGKNRRVKNKTIRRTRRNRKTVGGTPDLITASMNNDIAEVKRLLKARADVNACDEDGDTALMWAVFKGHKDVVKVLLEAGADVNASNKNGDTALMWAVFKGHKDVVKVLYEAGANPERLDPEGKKVFNNMIKPVNVPPPRQAWQG